MRVVTVEAEHDLAVCARDGGALQTIDTGVVGPVHVGDAVLVHAGVALAILEGPA